MSLTAAHLREVLDYDPDTGLFRWKCGLRKGKVAGAPTKRYPKIKIDQVTYFAHRLAWLYYYGNWPSNQVDHINGNKSDNRIENLRNVTMNQNMCNRGATSRNSNGYKGVHYDGRKSNKYYAVVTFNGKQHYLGAAKTAEEAYELYKSGSLAIQKEFSFLNTMGEND